jgi:hypothetical protein
LYAVIQFQLFGSKPKGSFVTGSTANSSENATSISPLKKAYRDILQSGSGILFNVGLFIASLGALVIAIQIVIYGDGGILTTLLTTVAWPPLLHLSFLVLFNNWVPVAHLFSHPVYYLREDRLVTTEKNISYPKTGVEKDAASDRSFAGLCCSFLVPMSVVGLMIGALCL